MYRLNVRGGQRPLKKEKKNESLNQHIARFQLTFVEKAIVSVARRTRIRVVSIMQRERERKREKREGRKERKKKKWQSVHFLRTMTV